MNSHPCNSLYVTRECQEQCGPCWDVGGCAHHDDHRAGRPEMTWEPDRCAAQIKRNGYYTGRRCSRKAVIGKTCRQHAKGQPTPDPARESLADHTRALHAERNNFAQTHMALIAWRDSEDDPILRRRINQILNRQAETSA